MLSMFCSLVIIIFKDAYNSKMLSNPRIVSFVRFIFDSTEANLQVFGISELYNKPLDFIIFLAAVALIFFF